MTLLSPFALGWLATIPVFLWLWRLASSRRQTAIPSLIPFERLLERKPRRRTTLVMNALFWLQLAALLGLVAALAQPTLMQHRARVVLTMLDTSASMGANAHGSSPFERARRALLAQIAHKPPTEQFFIVTTSPVTALTEQPTSDGVALARVVSAAGVSALGGNLATTARIGRALLGREPDELYLLTDESRPAEPLGREVQLVSVGQPLSNVGIVGVEAHGLLCSPADSRIIVTVQNFSTAASEVSLTAAQGGKRLATARATLTAHERSALPVTLPEGTEGIVEVDLAAAYDGLAVDNHAWIDLHRHATVPVTLDLHTPSIRQTIGAWLAACPALMWSDTASSGAHILITDREAGLTDARAPSLVFLPPTPAVPVRSYWLVATNHAIGAYLNPLEVVVVPLNLAPSGTSAGVPVITGFVGGHKVPIVLADEREGRRMVSMRFDPSGGEESTPVLLAFFNSLRWLMGETTQAVAGEPLLVHGLRAGAIQVRRPDGTTETVNVDTTSLRYERTSLAGLYRFSQGATTRTMAVNFLNPLESDLLGRVSTWRPMEQPARPVSPTHASVHPLTSVLLLIVLVMLLLEWWWYSRKGVVPGGGGTPVSPASAGADRAAATPSSPETSTPHAREHP